MSHKLISVIVPVYNEEENIDILSNSLEEQFTVINEKHDNTLAFEVLFINDGSTDNSLKIIKELKHKNQHYHYIDLSRNFGHQMALTAGIDHCNGDFVVIIDADMQDPPELIPLMYDQIIKGFDVVYAQRSNREGESWFKLATAKMYYKIMSKITSIDLPLDTGDYRMISKKVVNVLRNMPEHNKFIRGQIAWAGFKQTQILYDRNPRLNGQSGYSIKQMFKLAIDGVTGFSDLPLKLATYSGFISAFISVILVIYALISKYVLETAISGWTSIIITILFLGGIQLFCIGLIGEYILRIINNSRNRPHYLINESSFKNE